MGRISGLECECCDRTFTGPAPGLCPTCAREGRVEKPGRGPGFKLMAMAMAVIVTAITWSLMYFRPFGG